MAKQGWVKVLSGETYHQFKEKKFPLIAMDIKT